MLIHTPHLEDKYKGTRVSIDVLRRYPELEPGRVMIDHAEEHTIEMILEHGFWAGLTLYPQTKISPQRALDMIERYGAERICVAGACDWGPSDPIAVPQFIMEMRRRRHPEALIRRVVFDNPVTVPEPVAEVRAAGGRHRRRAGASGLSGTRRAPVASSRRPCQRPLGPNGLHLTYCTNIHPADGWAAVRRQHPPLRPALKARLSPARRSASACACPHATRASCSRCDGSTSSAPSWTTAASTSR